MHDTAIQVGADKQGSDQRVKHPERPIEIWLVLVVLLEVTARPAAKQKPFHDKLCRDVEERAQSLVRTESWEELSEHALHRGCLLGLVCRR